MAAISSSQFEGADDQTWAQNSVQKQINAAYSSHDAAIDRAIAETYGGSNGTGASRDGDGSQQTTPNRISHTRGSVKAGSGNSYGSRREKSRGQSATRVMTKGKPSADLTRPEDQDRWIHRDKLTQIEIQEYKDMGLEPPMELLRRAAESRQGTSREDAEALRAIKSPEPHRYDEEVEEPQQEYQQVQQQVQEEAPAPVAEVAQEEIYEQQYPEEHAYQRERVYEQEQEQEQPQEQEQEQEQEQAHQISYYNENDNDDDEDGGSVFVPVDPRSPAEIAADPYEDGANSPRYQGAHLLRKSNSKLPIAALSPLPVPQEPLDRGTPLPRKRGASGSHDMEGLAYPKVRTRKESFGSQVMVDEDDSSMSPTKSRSTSGKTVTKAKPKQSLSSTPKSRTTSTGRPGTSSGDRPRTATQSPEGDPPWINSAYQPDPRLPPDLQMLPTHAKRMMQEQWEREGKNGKAYDRDLKAVANFDDGSEALAAERAAAGRNSASPTKARARAEGLGIVPGDGDGEWPLSNSRSQSPTKATTPGTTGFPSIGPDGSPVSERAARVGGGGYSTTPRMTDSPKPGAVGLFPSPRPGDQPADAAAAAAIGGRPSPNQGRGQRSPTRISPAGQQPLQHQQLGHTARVTSNGDMADAEAQNEKKSGGGACGCCTVM